MHTPSTLSLICDQHLRLAARVARPTSNSRKQTNKQAWWHANKFPMHRFADTFDDVISTAVATGALGSGIAGPALRGGVVA